MGRIEKGVILTLEGELDRNGNFTRAKVQAASAGGTSTLPITIPWYLRGSMGMLEKDTKVVYVLFEDETGIVLSRLDGEWEGKMEENNLLLDMLGATLQIEGDVDINGQLHGGGIS